MKRSEINTILRDAEALLEQHRFHLPPLAYWSPEDWKQKGEEVEEIVDQKLGWDITDFGEGHFHERGLLLFTLRNGTLQNLKRGAGKLYAEKVMVVEVNQVTPLHFHWTKTEDIINRGGGNLVLQLYTATDEGELDDSDIVISVDGMRRTVRPGGMVTLHPGESITVPTRCYHTFWATNNPVLAGEVSLVNDDDHDNRFYSDIGRFPEIEEDEPPLYLLVNDYKEYYNPGEQ